MNKEQKNLIIVTDIDGTLMDHNYDLSPALQTIQLLKNLKIPIILCTSKTASEVREIRQNIGIDDPYIVENGAAIYGNESKVNNGFEIILGRSYKDLRKALCYLSDVINYPLIALNDLCCLHLEHQPPEHYWLLTKLFYNNFSQDSLRKIGQNRIYITLA